MSADSDWDPLPEPQRVSHPGEFAEPALVSPVPAPAQAAAAPVAAAAPDPASEAALRELRERLAAAPPASSFVAERQHRERREARRRAAANAPFADDARVAHSSLRPEDVPLPIALEPVPDRDPREDEDWYKALPAEQRERLRALWWHERHRHERGGAELQRRLWRAVGYGALVNFAASLLLVMLCGGFGVVPRLTAAGALAAGAAEFCGGNRFAYAFAGALVFVLVLGASLFQQPLLLMALMLTTFSMACIGMDGEMRRSGGFAPR